MSLQNIRAQRQQLTNTVASQLTFAKETHRRIQSRHQQLQRDLEASNSEFDISSNFIKDLEVQKASLEAAGQQIASLLHPIRRCPRNILKIIFQYAAQGEDPDYFRAATAISHVCQSWRAIALDTRMLWTRVPVSIEDPPKEVRSFSKRIRALVHSTPVEITVSKIGKKPIKATEKLFKYLELNKFASIDHLYLSLTTSEDIDHLIQSTFGPQSAFINTIQVSSESTSIYSFIERAWDYASILRHFSATKCLHIVDLGAVTLSGNDTFLSLQELRLINIHPPSIASHLRRLLNLKILEIRGGFGFSQLSPAAYDIDMSKLEFLSIMGTQGFSWSNFSAPRLEKVGIGDYDPDVMDFLCRHPSIRDLIYRGVSVDQEGIERLSRHLVQLESLGIMIDNSERLGHFTTSNQDTGLPPFPRLQTLSIEIDNGDIPAPKNVESLVKGRCQPSPESERGDLALVFHWNITGDIIKLENAEWRMSPLLEGWKQTLEKLGESERWATLSLTCSAALELGGAEPRPTMLRGA